MREIKRSEKRKTSERKPPVECVSSFEASPKAHVLKVKNNVKENSGRGGIRSK